MLMNFVADSPITQNVFVTDLLSCLSESFFLKWTCKSDHTMPSNSFADRQFYEDWVGLLVSGV